MATNANQHPPLEGNSAGRFGTFAGVFTPNVLTILGIILFLRTGWVVGQSGLFNALIIVLIANGITLLTGLSLSAVATSMNVGPGGNYYVISRSLGLEIGGAIGIPLFLSQAISVAFYIIGFTEAVTTLGGYTSLNSLVVALIVVVAFCIIALIGADFALKLQFVILAVLIAAIGSFFMGGWDTIIEPTWTATYTGDNSFWLVFSIFFPAVTGIAVGASMSGDLKDPSRSIPQGTLWSIGVTTVIYLAFIVWFALHISPADLVDDNFSIMKIARFPQLIFWGVAASTLSSALGSILAAPRTLQAIAFDDVVPRWMGSQMGSATEPRMAVLLTTAIAVAVILMGDLNFVAPVITMFFLNTYGMLNVGALAETLVGNPSFRPTIKSPWWASLLGVLGCYGTMFLINGIATVVAIVISYGIYFSLQRRNMRRTWGDVRSGIWITMARALLLQIEKQQLHAKNWRPNLLVFTGQAHNRAHLVAMADWLSLGRGIVTFFQLIVGDVEELAGQGLRTKLRAELHAFIASKNMDAFAEVEIVPEFRAGALTMVQGHGIAGLEPNSILMGWGGSAEGQIMQLDLIRTLVALKKSVLFLCFDESRGFGRMREINVWWKGRGGNADLMLLLAHLISQHRSWNRPQINLLMIADDEGESAEIEANLTSILKEVRVQATPRVVVRQSGQLITDIVSNYPADLTLLGMLVPGIGESEAYQQRINSLIDAVGSVLLVRNAEDDADLLSTG